MVSQTPPLDEDAIERAEEALKTMADRFGGWIDEEVALLAAARDALKTDGISQTSIDAFSERAHDIKGQGATLNYPFVSKIAEQLCRLCEHLPTPNDFPLALVEAHVDALRAVVRDGIKGDDDPLSRAVVTELSGRVAETLAAWRAAAAA
jgi:AcrR family transcriptional regulator